MYDIISLIRRYFNVSRKCATYLYFKSKEGHLHDVIQQNMIIYNDRDSSTRWNSIDLDDDFEVVDTNYVVMRWFDSDLHDGWKKVTRGKKKMYKLTRYEYDVLTRNGLYI